MLGPSLISSLDMATLAHIYQAGEFSPQDVLAVVLKRIAAYPDPAVWIHLLPSDEVLAQAATVQKRWQTGESLPLYGIPFAIKDNIDLAGHPTTAGCPAFSYVAKRSAPVVQRLLDAGAILVGKTNLDQFATGLAGDRSPYGACRNVFDPAYISGGSSSGSAVAVAAGLVSFALGTDTAGSGRVPAGCNNIVGLKPTPGLLSADSVVPACRSLDCVSILALTAEDAGLVCAAALGQSAWGVNRNAARLTTFAAPRDEDREFCGDETQAELFRGALASLQQAGVRQMPIDFRPFREVGALLYDGPWLAERFAALEDFLQGHSGEMHPVTRGVLEKGAKIRAVDVFRGGYRLKELRAICLEVFKQAEVLVVPTMPTIPTRAEVQADSPGWSRRLGTYTNFVNLLGLAALAVPAGFTTRGLPAGITLIGPAGSEARLCELGMTWQRDLNLSLGATEYKLPPVTAQAPAKVPAVAANHVRVSVAGAHLHGQPLHPALLRFGAHFVRACRTAPRYRFMAFMDLEPPRPGLLRDEDRAGAVAVEIYDLPMEGFGRLVASVAPPLAIGTVELEDGEAVKGFLCESWHARQARDITDFGGWIAFVADRSAASRSAAHEPQPVSPKRTPS